MSFPWLAEVLELWEPPPLLGGADWADRFRVLGPDESAEPGPWRCVGWQRYVLDLFADPSVDWVVALKAAQMGVSELVRCAIGRWALCDPGDVLWVMANELAADKAMEKLKTMFRNTPALEHLLPRAGEARRGKRRKNSLKELVLTNGMRIVIGWAGSPSSLASDPFPRVIGDETGIWPAKVGKEGSPVGLIEERTKTFGRRRKVILLSKPAHPDDLICTSHAEIVDQRERHVPCPDCGDLAPLAWGRVRWLDSEGCTVAPIHAPTDPAVRILMAAHVERSQSAWVECRACGGKIVDTRAADADQRAAWLRVGEDTTTPTRRRGIHISELYHWSKTVSDLVARFLRAVKPADAQNFHTGSLGRPYEQERTSLKPETFLRKASHRPGLIPSYATALIASVDTQKDYLMFVVRAWGAGDRSRTIDFGRVDDVEVEQDDGTVELLPDFDGLLARTLHATWPVAGTDRYASPVTLVIDAGGGKAGREMDGSRSQLVYKFALSTPGVVAAKGSGAKKGANEGSPLTWSLIRFGEDKEQQLKIAQPHANYWKDYTATLCRGDRWEETTQSSDKTYTSQMTGQRQVYEQQANGVGRWVWRKRSGRDDHLFDCSYLNTVGAFIEAVNDRRTLRDTASEQTKKTRQQHEDDDGDDDWVAPYMRGNSW